LGFCTSGPGPRRALPHRDLPAVMLFGMVGGGPGAFIGDVHRRAAELDGQTRLVSGAFSSGPEASRAKGRELGLDPALVFGDYRDMAAAQNSWEADQRIDFVVVVTPNHLHYPVARAFLEAGVDVVCDKPLTTSVEHAEALCRLTADRGRRFAVTYTYTGYSMLREARHLARSGALGKIRRIQVEYFQGWLARDLESTGHRQASWRTDPARAGPAGALGDIGTHGFNLAHWTTGLDLAEVVCDTATFVEGRSLEDDASVLWRWEGGARGALSVSQSAAGAENDLALTLMGSEASLWWRHTDPESLVMRDHGGRTRVLRRGGAGLSPRAAGAGRLPAGHPEGFTEAMANIYRDFLAGTGYPTVQDGARGVAFVDSVLASARSGRWTDASYSPPGG